jgi:imidazoleglycerol phosphate synthase cyclase subunit
MLTRRLIPCLDTRDGRVVKGRRFVDLRDAGSPVELARRYDDGGADELILLDVTATPEGRANALETVRAVRQVLTIPLTVGGGVRAIADAEALLTAGADKVAINTAALIKPGLLDSLAARFGRQCVVLAIDAAALPLGGWGVFARSGSEATSREPVEWAVEGEQRGAGEILLTCIDRDGTGEGFDLALIEAVSSRIRLPVIASGGASSAAHCLAALEAGADAVLAASMFHDDEVSIREVKRFLALRGVEIRQ